LVLWGASVGPFDALPEYKPYMINHLQRIPGIFARESVTEEYLKRNNIVSNVYVVADPAFLLDSKEPRDTNGNITIEEDAIGINFSPLMAKYVCEGDIKLWEKIAADIMNLLSKKWTEQYTWYLTLQEDPVTMIFCLCRICFHTSRIGIRLFSSVQHIMLQKLNG
jgi:polysaccharide pyruvyl transferase WcaK-like protein